MNTAFVTFIYPAAKSFFKDFLNTLENQTDINFKLFIFNDGCTEEEIKFFYSRGKFEFEIIENSNKSLAENRMNAFKYLVNQPFSHFIFGDIDDTFAENRVEIVKAALKNKPLVINELTLCNTRYEIIEPQIIQSYLGLQSQVSLEMLREHNLIGFSHTAMNKEVVKQLAMMNLDSNVKVVDWVVMSKLLTKYVAFFETKTHTNYIFHESNLALFREATLKELLFLIDVKVTTYSQLLDVATWYENEMYELLKLKKQIETDEMIQEKLIKWYSAKEETYYPWWGKIKNSEELKNEF